MINSGASRISGYYSIEFYRDFYNKEVCKHCKKIIHDFEYVLMFTNDKRDRQEHMFETFCFCNFTQSQIKQLIKNKNEFIRYF